MYALLFTLIAALPIKTADPQIPGSAGQHDDHCATPLPPVILVADGSSEAPGKAAGKIVAELMELLGSCRDVKVAWFDAEPKLQYEFAVRGANRDLVMVRPRTPMREAMETGFVEFLRTRGPGTMIVIANAQFYPTSVSTKSLLELAQRSHTTVHTIHLPVSQGRRPMARRLAQSLRGGAVWAVEVLGLGERGYSARDTALMLKTIADATGGAACVTTARGNDCVQTLAAWIAGEPSEQPSDSDGQIR